MNSIDIINMALSDCGQDPIVSIDDGTAAARQAKSKYAALRDATLEDREWTFAKGRLILAQDVAVPAWGLSYQYIIPSNVLRVLRVYNNNGLASGSPLSVDDWVREGWRVLTDEAGPIFAEVIQRVDEGTFSPTMVLALSARLTAAFAIPLTENRQLAKDFSDKYQALLIDAAAMDGSQGRSQRLRPLPLPGRQQNL